jgi:transcriptional regulator with XRE-family HTH domain
LGERIAAYRRRRGLSQATLAGLVGRSESWLSQVERGIRSVDRLSVLLDLARVLRVDVEALLGRPWQYAPNGGHEGDELAPVRLHFSRYDDLLGVTPAEPPTLSVLRAQVAATHVAYQAAGANVKAVQRMLGHASAAMTLDVYAGLFGDDLDAVAERLDQAFSGRAANQVRTTGTGDTVTPLPPRGRKGR